MLLDGYGYTKKVTNKTTIRWACANRTKETCDAALSTDTQVSQVISPATPHSHPADVNLAAATKLRVELKERAAIDRGNPSQVVADVMSQYPIGARAAAGQKNTIKRAVRRAKRGQTPVEPDCIQDIPPLAEEFTTTGGEDNFRFLIYDNYDEGSPNNNRVLVFATEYSLKHLCKSDHWFMDGTFGTAPKQFQQIFVIHAADDDNLPLTCVYALLPRKSNETYKEVFTAVLNACENYNLIPYPTVVSCDFEQAIHKAILSTFGHVRIQGCFFHLTQSTWRRIQEEGLTGRYKADEDAKHFCGMLDSLAFLPPNQVKEGMAFLRTRIPDGFEGVVDYFDSNYVNGPFTATRLPGGRMRLARCTSPRYSIEVWNVYQATMDGTGRTNNVCESWNHSFGHLVGHKNPGLYHVIRSMINDQLGVLTEMERINLGRPSTQRLKKKAEHHQARLKGACLKLTNGRLSMAQFLHDVGRHIRLVK